MMQFDDERERGQGRIGEGETMRERTKETCQNVNQFISSFLLFGLTLFNNDQYSRIRAQDTSIQEQCFDSHAQH